MKLLYNTQTEELLNWPRIDEQSIEGLDTNLLEMTVIQESEPTFDSETEQLIGTETIDIEAQTVTRGWDIIPIPAPTRVTSRQFFKALALDGHGEEEILEKAEEAGFDLIQMLDLKAELKGNYFDRSNPMIAMLAPVLGYTTPEDIDEVFRKASQF